MAFHVWKKALGCTTFQPHWKAFFNPKAPLLAQKNDALRLMTEAPRILRVGRYVQAVERLKRAGRMVREELVLFIGVSLALIYLSAVGVYYFEHDSQPEKFASVFHSLWWAVVTLTTVGYGDVYPVTLGGHLFTFVVLFIGLGIVAVPTGLIASALSKAREGETD